MNTELKYFTDMWKLEDRAKVVDVRRHEDDRDIVILDGTIFYPQGGGQPYDKGEIVSDGGVRFLVEEVRFVEGEVWHIGKFAEGSLEAGSGFAKGEEVVCKVEPERRALNSKVHAAAHVIDFVLYNLGYKWEPVRGHHIPDEAYVNYRGEVGDGEAGAGGDLREKFRQTLESEVNKAVKLGGEVSCCIVDGKEKLKEICDWVVFELPENKPIRVVSFMMPLKGQTIDCAECVREKRSLACGGTHVRDLREIGQILIPKVSVKKGLTKISYRVA